jgi:hypothetical protein
MQQRYLKLLLALTVLTFCLSGQLFAEKLQSRVSQGNNMQVEIQSGAYGPFMVDGSCQGKTQSMFPAGSGNTWGHDAMGFFICAASDLDGDGEPEDTTMPPHGRNSLGCKAGPEDVDEVAAVFASGQNTETICSDINHMRVWSSLDDDDLADWPVGGRESRSPSGEIVKYGAETIFTVTGDVLRAYGYGNHNTGYYQENTFIFLNYGESNDMVYVLTESFNMTELTQYSAEPAFAASGAEHPSGWTWKGAAGYYQHRCFCWGNSYSVYTNLWGYHYAKDIHVTFNPNPLQSNWTPPEYPLFCFASLKLPTHTTTGEQMEMTNFQSAGGSMGVSGSLQLCLSGKSVGQVYRNIMDTEDFLPGVINPFTGRHHNAWPGRLLPTDARYNQWIWGGGDAWITDKCYGELHDVAPRESIKFDYVLFFVYPPVLPFVPPPLDAGNIDASVIQEALAPAEQYTETARIVYEGGYKLPETPQAPRLTIIPGDREVSITWSDVNLNTPDNYYYFLQENDLDPEGRYVEYDFEGFHVYRSFVGPNDTHSELLEDFNRSSGNLQFYYVDKFGDDYPMYRMRNGMKVWYAVVPYDKNYDVATGEMFSLPLPESAKTWNRPGEAIYSVVPRSNANEFRLASLFAVAYDGPATVPASTAELAGDGSGNLTQAPAWLTPPIGDVVFTSVNEEKITSDKSVYIECCGWWHTGEGCGSSRPEAGIRKIRLVDGSYQSMPVDLLSSRRGAEEQTLVFNDEPADDGVAFSIQVPFQNLVGPSGYRAGSSYFNIDKGSYPGEVRSITARGCGPNARPGTAPNLVAIMRNGRFTVTWQSGSGGMAVQVQDLTRGTSVPAVQYQDEEGWGFMTSEEYGSPIEEMNDNGLFYIETFVDQVPKSERTAVMTDQIPADHPEPFAIWLNGLVWVVLGGMPADGTVWTIDNAWGKWNEDQTVFTQEADLPWPGDKWKIEIKAMTMDPEDSDLTKIKVVPNPYIASSYLDLSPNNRRIEFINLPSRCTIRIYSLGGNLVNALNHIGANRQGWGNYTDWDRLTDNEPRVFTGYDNHSGTEPWNLRNRFGQTVASGLYFYHVTDQRGEAFTGKFYVIN